MSNVMKCHKMSNVKRHLQWPFSSGRVSQVVVSWLAANEDQKNLWGPWDLEGIRTFVAKWDMSRIRAFWYCFDSDLTQTNAIWLRLYSDIWSKNGDWSLWSSVAVRLSSVLSPQSSVLGPRSSVLGPQFLSIFGCILKFSILVNFNHP